MAKREDVLDAFYDELETAVEGAHTVTYGDGSTDTITVDSENVSSQHPTNVESLPAVIYDDSYVRLSFNDVGSGPDEVVTDSNGVVQRIIWKAYIEAQYLLTVQASSDIVKEPIYEAMRRQFEQYRFPQWDETTLHADVIDVDVLDATSADVGSTEDPIKGDALEVRIQFHRNYEFTTDTIDSVEHAMDLELTIDGDEVTYTTS